MRLKFRLSRYVLIRLGVGANIILLIILIVYYSRSYSYYGQEIGRVENALMIKIYRDRDRNFSCEDLIPLSSLSQRGNYWVFYNYKSSAMNLNCDESITYTTHSDFNYLDTLIPLLERWKGPISIALYSPGTDFEDTIERINYVRECTSSSQSRLVKTYVSFHLFFDKGNIPKSVRKYYLSSENFLKATQDFDSRTIDCSSARINFDMKKETFRTANNLVYPINVARNIARGMASTHYVLSSDIELLPSLNLIPQFLDMVERYRYNKEFDASQTSAIVTNWSSLNKIRQKKVFVLPIFEVEEEITKLPDNKAELQVLLQENMSIPFHSYVCPSCHRIPKQTEWQNSKMSSQLNVFSKFKRQNSFKNWEPIYIGTKFDPIFDERLSWDGQMDKMIQNYIMCLLDYDYHILDNAFLVHSPGIKRSKVNTTKIIRKQRRLIKKKILPEVHRQYGKRKGC